MALIIMSAPPTSRSTEPPPTTPPTEPSPTTPGIFQTATLTQNQWNTAGALSALEQSGESLRLYNNLMVLDAESARNAVDQLSGDYHSNTSTALIANSQVVFGVLGTRMRDLLDTGTLRMPAMALNLMPSTFITLRNAQPTRYV